MKEQDDIILWKYLDGSLTDWEKKDVDERLLSDPSFRALFEEIQELDGDLKELSDDEVSPDFSEQLMLRLPRKTARKVYPIAQGGGWTAAIIAAVIVILSTSLYLLTLGPGDELAAANAQGAEVLDSYAILNMLIWTGYAITILVIFDFFLRRRYRI